LASTSFINWPSNFAHKRYTINQYAFSFQVGKQFSPYSAIIGWSRAFFPSLRVALEGHFTILIGTIHKPNRAVNFYKIGRFSQFKQFHGSVFHNFKKFATQFFTILNSSRLNFSQFWKVHESFFHNFEKFTTHFFTKWGCQGRFTKSGKKALGWRIYLKYNYSRYKNMNSFI
jgi:hypothetical protein